jgi:hypothetical protein
LWKQLPVALCLSFAVLLALACEKRRQPCRYLIPEGFVGWVLIEYNVDGASLPREETGFLVLEVPTSGMLSIPGSPQSGWAQDEYFYVDGQGSRERLRVTPPGSGGVIWGTGVGSYEEDGAGLTAEHFFVGTEAEFARAPKLDDLLRSRASESRRR